MHTESPAFNHQQKFRLQVLDASSLNAITNCYYHARAVSCPFASHAGCGFRLLFSDAVFTQELFDGVRQQIGAKATCCCTAAYQIVQALFHGTQQATTLGQSTHLIVRLSMEVCLRSYTTSLEQSTKHLDPAELLGMLCMRQVNH